MISYLSELVLHRYGEQMDKINSFMALSCTLIEGQGHQPIGALDGAKVRHEYMPVWLAHIEQYRKGLAERVLDTFEALQEVTPKLSREQLTNAMLAERNGRDFVQACQQLVYLCQKGSWPGPSM